MYIVAIIELLPNRGFHFEEAVGPFDTKDDAFVWADAFRGKPKSADDSLPHSADDSSPTKPPEATFVVELKSPFGPVTQEPDERAELGHYPRSNERD